MHHLTKSKFTSGLTCPRQLWFKVHDPVPYVDPLPGEPMDIGNHVGRGAHTLFQGGVEVKEAPWEHAQAVAQTRKLMDDPAVPSIFEAAFEYENVRIRVDVLERLSDGAWCIREVKSSGSVKQYHLWDAAVQLWVADGSGVDLSAVSLIHVDTDYVYVGGALDWSKLLVLKDITEDCINLQADVAAIAADQLKILQQTEPPNVHPNKSRCKGSFTCDYWDRCSAALPNDWVQLLPGIRSIKVEEWAEAGIHAISDLPNDASLNLIQQRVVDVMTSGEPFISPDLGDALKNFGPPAYYFDFETIQPMLPVYAGTSPGQQIPFQWSLHHLSADGKVTHAEYLGPIVIDPRRELAESLIDAIKDDGAPVLAYNASFEGRVLRTLADQFVDLAERLLAIEQRLLDPLSLVKRHTYFPGYKGSFSLKTVGPTLAPEHSYEDLEGVAVGTDASAAYWQMVYTRQDDPDVRQALLAYCMLDTEILMAVHQRLNALAAAQA